MLKWRSFFPIILCGMIYVPISAQDANIKIDSIKTEQPVQTPSKVVKVGITVEQGETTLLFDWGSAKPALAVIKGATSQTAHKWWVVFDEKAQLTLPDHQHLLPESIEAEKGTVVQFVVPSHLIPSIQGEDNTWRIVFQTQAASKTKNPIIKFPQTSTDGLSVALDGTGKEVRFTDPHTGYQIVVFTSHQIGFGLDQGEVFPEFQLLETAQGISLAVRSDNVTLQSTSQQVIVNGNQGLAVSSLQDREEVRKFPVTIGFFSEAQDLDWLTRRAKIDEELSDFSHDQHGPGELEIAWLLLSYGHTNEAMGYLTHLAQERPSMSDVPLFHLLRGVGSILLNQLEEAQNHLWFCRNEPETQIWLALINVHLQPHFFTSDSHSLLQLRSQFLSAKAMLHSYPKPLRNQLSTLILVAGIALKDDEILKSILEQETRPEHISSAEVYDLARARILLNQKKPDEALQLLGELMERGSSPMVRAIARFDYVTYRLATDMMTKNEGIPQLVSLKTQWERGWLGRQIGDYLKTQVGSAYSIPK